MSRLRVIILKLNFCAPKEWCANKTFYDSHEFVEEGKRALSKLDSIITGKSLTNN